MSYILGYIVSDGCIHKRKDRKCSYVLNITSKDREHLLKIRDVLETNYPISRKYNSQKISYFQIQISNKEVCQNLISLGILPRKTHNLNFIEVSKKYFPHFVRGFFDGDGTVYIYRVNKTLQIKAGFVSSSPTFIKKFNRQLCGEMGIPCKNIHKVFSKDKNLPQYSIYFYIDDCERLVKFMYGDNSSLYLSRKRLVFEKWKLIKRRNYIKQNYPSKIGWRLNEKVLA
ncbi:MAG: LAGLIDADG family homing endonuclease [Candidatus Paceibacterota bacterium]